MGKLVKWVTKTYGKIPIIITENGMPDDGTSLQDDIRIEQIRVSKKYSWSIINKIKYIY